MPRRWPASRTLARSSGALLLRGGRLVVRQPRDADRGQHDPRLHPQQHADRGQQGDASNHDALGMMPVPGLVFNNELYDWGINLNSELRATRSSTWPTAGRRSLVDRQADAARAQRPVGRRRQDRGPRRDGERRDVGQRRLQRRPLSGLPHEVARLLPAWRVAVPIRHGQHGKTYRGTTRAATPGRGTRAGCTSTPTCSAQARPIWSRSRYDSAAVGYVELRTTWVLPTTFSLCPRATVACSTATTRRSSPLRRARAGHRPLDAVRGPAGGNVHAGGGGGRVDVL